jgi:hypothetical protein
VVLILALLGGGYYALAYALGWWPLATESVPEARAEIYQSESGGFELSLPTSWTGYRAVTEDNGCTYFSIPTAEPGWDGFADIFAICRKTLEVGSDMPSGGEELFRIGEDAVYAAYSQNQPPADAAFAVGDADAIVKTVRPLGATSPTVDAMTGLKTYNHPEFSFRYPESWAYYQANDTGIYLFSSNLTPPVEVRANKVIFSFRASSERPPASDSLGYLTVGGAPAVQNTRIASQGANDNGGPVTDTRVYHKGKAYDFQLVAGHDGERPEYDALLSSFRFKDSNVREGWTIYEDTGNGFEIQYPGERYFRTSSAEPQQVVALTGTQDNDIYYVSVFALPLRKTDGVPCGEGHIRPHEVRGTVFISGAEHPACIIDRENLGDEALHISFNRGERTWLFQATKYDKYKASVDEVLSTFRFTQ